VTLTIPNDSLSRLPKGACFQGQEGRAKVKVSRNDDNDIVVESTCDSLERRCVYLEDELVRIRNALQRQEDQSSSATAAPTPWQQFWIHVGQVLAGAVLALLVIFLLKRHFKSI
jgi:hypothetical protein